MGRLDSKVAMITGAGGEHGLGRAIARRFADEGADLVLVDVAPTGLRVSASTPAGGWRGIEAVAEEVRTRGRRVLTALADVRVAAQVEAVVARAVAEYGRIDVLVNNAGAPGSLDRTLVVDLPEDAWDTVRRSAYCASKFGIIGFTQSLAQELASAGITVNAICPSAVETERLDHLGFQPDGTVDLHQREQRIKEIGAATPVGRVGRPEDVAEVAAFLAGDAADYITGQSINVTGGGVMH